MYPENSALGPDAQTTFELGGHLGCYCTTSLSMSLEDGPFVIPSKLQLLLLTLIGRQLMPSLPTSLNASGGCS